MISLIFDVLKVGLGLWQSKEKRKYMDKLLALKRDYYEEYNKEDRDDAVLDNLEFELKLLSDSFISLAGQDATKEN